MLGALLLGSPADAEDFGLQAIVPLTSPVAVGPVTRSAVRLATDGDGTWVIKSAVGAVRSTDGGVGWSDVPGVPGDRFGSVATDGVGAWVLAFEEPVVGETAVSDIAVMRSGDGGATWTAPTPHFVGGMLADLEDVDPEVATNGVGTWLLIWSSSPPDCVGASRVRVSRSIDAGATWSAPVDVEPTTTGPCPLRRPTVAGDAAGNWVATWVGRDVDSYLTPRIVVARSSDDGVSWTAPALTGDAGSASFDPHVAVAGGTWLLSYPGGIPTGLKVHRSTDAGATWSPSVTVRVAFGTTAPRLAGDGAGTWTVVWSEQDQDGALDREMLVARSLDDGVTWTPHEPLEGNARLDAPHRNDYGGAVAPDGGGGWLAAWRTDVDGSARVAVAREFTCATDAECQPCERCDGMTSRCVVRPLAGCRTPTVAGQAKLQFKDFDFTEAHDKLSWKWLKGDATPLAAFGDPGVSEDYLLCGYDESGGVTDLFFRAIVPAGATCDGQPCWHPLGTQGFTYKDASDVRPQGIWTVKLVAGESGNAKIVVKGKGRVLAYRPFGLPYVPYGPFPVPLRVQLEASNGECWEATYSTVKKAVHGFATSVFKAASD